MIKVVSIFIISTVRLVFYIFIRDILKKMAAKRKVLLRCCCVCELRLFLSLLQLL